MQTIKLGKKESTFHYNLPTPNDWLPGLIAFWAPQTVMANKASAPKSQNFNLEEEEPRVGLNVQSVTGVSQVLC